MTFHLNQNGYHQENKINKLWWMCRENGNPYILLMKI